MLVLEKIQGPTDMVAGDHRLRKRPQPHHVTKTNDTTIMMHEYKDPGCNSAYEFRHDWEIL